MNKIENENEMECVFCGNTKCNKSDWVHDCPDCGKWFYGDDGSQCIIETKCHACEVIHNPQDVGCKTVLCEEAGWINLCKDCPVYKLCIYCNDYIHPDDVIKVGEDYQCKPMGVEPQQECLRRVLCYKCDKFVHPDTAMVVGEVTGRHAHVCKKRCYY